MPSSHQGADRGLSAVDRRGPIAWLTLVLVALVWSGIQPADRATWWAEALPVMIGVPILLATFSRHPLTPLLYGLIAVHCVILVVGARYTYAEVPLGFWMQDWFGFERNHYDRIGHLAQGFVPAILAREVLLRATPLRRGGWLFYLVLCVCLSFSAFYELIEWVAAETAGQGAEAFLGTQGDEWDAQKDMLLALIGAIASQLLLARAHDRQLASVAPHALAKDANR
jgi:putative membrane protein